MFLNSKNYRPQAVLTTSFFWNSGRNVTIKSGAAVLPSTVSRLGASLIHHKEWMCGDPLS